MARIKFMNTEVDNLTFDESLKKIDEIIQTNNNGYVVTPNVDHIVRLESNTEFQKIYKNADLILTDGKPLIWISNWYKTPIKEKISGSDLFPLLCQHSSKRDYRMYFLGSAEGVADKAAQNLCNKFPGLQVVGTYSPPYEFEQDRNEIKKIIRQIKAVSPTILVVGLGSPKQENFIFNYKEELNVPISLGLGASLDFEAGIIKRAPRWMRSIGLEWLYRLCKEPKRMFKRYIIDDIKFFSLIRKYRR